MREPNAGAECEIEHGGIQKNRIPVGIAKYNPKIPPLMTGAERPYGSTKTRPRADYRKRTVNFWGIMDRFATCDPHSVSEND
jgi:hypothetical protein